MAIEEALVKLNKDEQKNYLLRYLLTMSDDERNEFINSITDKDLLQLVKKQLERVELIQKLRNKGIQNDIVNSTVYSNYLNILKNYKSLADKLLIINPVEISILFSYLLWNGYFSMSKHNVFKNDNIFLLCHLYPYTIMSGTGVCLNHSILLTDYLNICGIEASPMEAYIKNRHEKPSYIPPIERDTPNIKKEFNLNSLRSEIAKETNHVFTLIKENGQYYIYDPTNLMIFAIKSPTKAKCTAMNLNATLYPISSYEIIDNDIAYKTLNSFITTSTFKECPYNANYFKFIAEQALEIIKQNISLLDDCYGDSHDDIHTVGQYVKERKIRHFK